ncbi:tetraacyldisaccharide 4'-kinase [candidate division KSB1 bacterium]|nr:tetraacyldisaccharide 4'-kinase [candidate division KSB1 bacterium]
MRFFDRIWPAILLWPFSLLYAGVIDLRNALYDRGILRVHHLACRVISVGNLSVGGTGKTPTVQYLARRLQQHGKAVAVLSRGYGRESRGMVMVSDGQRMLADSRQGGDEPVMLAQTLPGIPVLVDRDRVRGGHFLEQRFHPDVILLDDGFQHRRLHRDVDIVTFCADSLWGNGFCLPAGPLRERRTHLNRADLIWLNGKTPAHFSLDRVPQKTPRLFADYEVEALVGQKSRWPVDILRGERVLAFCGIARPNRFRDQLRLLGVEIRVFRSFSDHYAYSLLDIEALEHQAAQFGCTWIVTTEKDWNKLEKNWVGEKWGFLRMTIRPKNTEILKSLGC